MQTSLPTAPGRHDHPPQPTERQLQTASVPTPAYAPRRVGLLDRAALHLGVALIHWGRRPRAVRDPARNYILHERRDERLKREREAERMMWLTLPWR